MTLHEEIGQNLKITGSFGEELQSPGYDLDSYIIKNIFFKLRHFTTSVRYIHIFKIHNKKYNYLLQEVYLFSEVVECEDNKAKSETV